MSSDDGEASGFGSGFLSAAGDKDDVMRLVGFEAPGLGDEAAFLDRSELCSDLHTSFTAD